MPLSVTCSSCGVHGQVPDKLAGHKVKCKCGGVLLVPPAAAPARPARTSGLGPKKPTEAHQHTDTNPGGRGKSRGVGGTIAIAVLVLGLGAGAGAGFLYRDEVASWIGVDKPAGPASPGATEQPPAVPASERPALPKRVQRPTGVAMALDSGGHTAAVNQILFTPDGGEIITVSDDCTIRVWSTLTGESVRVLRPPVGRGYLEGMLKAAALAPDGHRLAVAYYGGIPLNSEDTRRAERTGTILLIALEAGRIERVLKEHTDNVNQLAFSPDGKWLASSALDFSVRLWDVASGNSVHELKGDVAVNGLAFSADSRRLAVVREGRQELVLWQVATGQKDKASLLDGAKPTCVAWSPDGKTIAVGGRTKKKSITLLNADGSLRKRLTAPSGRINTVVFTRDSRALLVTGIGNYCALLGLDGKERACFKGHTGKVATGEANIRAGALAPDGALAVTGGMPEEVFVWRTADATVVHRLTGKGGSAVSVGWSPDGKTLAWGTTRDPGATDLNRQGPLERTFSLTDLELGGPPDVPFLQARTVLGQRSLEQLNRTQVALKEGKALLAKLSLARFDGQDKLNNGGGARFACFTLIPGDLAALGGQRITVFRAKDGKATWVQPEGIHALAPFPDKHYLLAACSNQTLRIWDASVDKEALLSLFFAGDDWIVWTERGGYYAASPGGEKLLTWHVTNGPDQMATIHPAARFHPSLYRPDVIKLVLKHGSVEGALEEADKAHGQKTPLREVADVLPPTVVITNPDQALTVMDATLEVRAQAHSVGQHPVTALRLLLDGRPYGGDKGLKAVTRPGPGPARASWQLTLTPGTHQLAVQAESDVSKGLSEPVRVTLDASRGLKKVLPTPEQQRAELPALHVLAVGISDYPGDLKLNFAHRDAEVLAKSLAAHGKDLYREVKVEVLTNKNATRRNILKKLGELSRRMTQRDVAVVGFAGHGDRDSKGRFFLLPVDADPGDLLSSCVDGEQVKSVLADMPGRIILLLDACHSGAVGRERTRARSALTDDLVRDLASDDYGVVVMCSAMGREFALESPTVKHGYFTLALVEGLGGKAANKEGVVYLNQLDTYVTDRVRELSHGRQHPVTTRPTSIRSFPLARP